MKIHPVEAKLFHADTLTHMIKLTVAFHNSTNASKNNINRKIRIKANHQTTEV